MSAPGLVPDGAPTMPGTARARSRGAVIAFVGSEATGKSTMLQETGHWLAQRGPVVRVHVGKPPSTALTALPNRLLPALRALLPEQRSTRMDARYMRDAQSGNGMTTPPLAFAVRSVLLAHDRRALLRSAVRHTAAGTVVLCDRYPSDETGAPDSRQLRADAVGDGHRLLTVLQRLEAHLYRSIPPPDVVFHLHAPLEVTLQRNQTRSKVEPEDLVRLRHTQTGTLRFEGVPVHRIDTTRSLEQCLQDVRRCLAELL